MDQAFGVLTKRTVAQWVGVLLAVVALLSVLVGFAAESWDEFNWEVASIFGTALGTTALAGFTGALAFTTSGDVRATWELARLTRQQQQAQERPIVVARFVRFSGSPENGQVEVGLVNVGLGPALRIDLRVEYRDDEHPCTASLVRPALRPGEDVVLGLSVRFTEPYPQGGVRGDGFALAHGTYLDRTRQRSYDVITDWMRGK